MLIQARGEPEDRYAHLLDDYAVGFNSLGYNHQYLVTAWGVREPGDVALIPEFLQRCDSVVQTILR